MNEINYISFYENLNTLFNAPNKTCKFNLSGKIEEINSNSEEMLLSVKFLEKYIFKGLYAIKGDIFPLPKINDNIHINEIQFKLTSEFNLGFFIKFSKDENIYSEINENKHDIVFDFTKDNIIKELINIFNITQKLNSKIFIIEDDSSENNYILRCIEDKKIYFLSKDTKNFTKKEILYIFNYYYDNNNIELTKISLVEKLTEEDLVIIIENNENLKNIFFLGKIIEISTDIIILVSNEKKLYKLVKRKVKKINKDFEDTKTNKEIFDKLKKNEIKIGQLFLITNYKEENYENNIIILETTNNSFIYFSNQDIYFSDNIKLNNISVIQFHFLDFIHDKNYYNEIEVKGINQFINSSSINIIIENKKLPNYEYYPISIKLISNKEDSKKSEIISFKFNLYHGFLNKINAYINHKCKKPYFYEYIYYSLNPIFLKANKKITIQNRLKCINICDNFESSNRIRFNILNIPIQNENINKLENSNSIMICEVFKEINPTIVGIFDINEIENNIPKLISNEIFDAYYEYFGFIYNFLSDYNNIKDENIKKIKAENFVKVCKNNYKNNIKDKNVDFLSINNYENKISKSQMKARLGILVSYYLNQVNEKNIEKIKEYFNIIINVFTQVNDKKEYLTDLQFFRLFKYLVHQKIKFLQSYKICIIPKLDEKSPILLAYKYNIEEIKNIMEISRLFIGYLQLDSYMLKNYLLNNHPASYSLSIEPLFIIKNHLLSGYENFILIEFSLEKHYAQSNRDERITIINSTKIFKNSNIIDFDIIEDEGFLKNHAFAVSMELRHKNNFYHKKNQKNSNIRSPIYYIDKTEIKSIEYKKDEIIQGEDGRFIEAYIDENREFISDLKYYIIYGELLDYKLFIKEDFNELKEKKKLIDNSKKKFRYSINESKNENNKANLIVNVNEQERVNYEESYQILKKYGTIMISDEEYTLFLFNQMIKTAKKNRSFSQLPKLMIYIDQRMKEEENKKSI